MNRPSFCTNCPLATGPGGFVPPTCNCPACTGKGLKDALHVLFDDDVAECQANVLIVGIAPGSEEERQGKVLVGPSGRILTAALNATNASDMIHVRKLNLVQCRTVRSGLSRQYVNRDPLKAEVDFCRQHFLDPELQAFRKRNGDRGIVILLGGLVYTHVTKGAFGSFAEARGHRFQGKLT